MNWTQFHLMRAGLVAAVLALFGVVANLMAQAPQPQQATVFVHGLGNTSVTWQATADRLAQDLAIQAHRPGLTSYSTFATQSAQLRNFMNGLALPPNSIAIGYSNGGIVSRKANVDGQSFEGIITAGTPHAGAELARSFLSGRVANFAEFVLWEIAAPFQYYAYYWDRWSLLAYGFASFMYSAVLYIDDRMDEMGYLAQNTVLPEMYPGSDFLAGTAGINSPSNLSREATGLLRRVGITSQFDPRSGYYGVVWRGVRPDAWGTLTSLQYKAVIVLLLAYEYYANYWDDEDPDALDKRLGAYLWLGAASAVAAIDPFWCVFIGASHPGDGCQPSDGIVPVTSQRYPSATRERALVGPAHLQLPNSVALQDGLAVTLVDDFSVRRRITGVLASPTSVSLTPGQSATVTATAVDRYGNPEFATITWQTANTGVATVNQSGVITGVADGSTTVTASAYDFTRAISVAVTGGQTLSSVTLSGPETVASGALAEWTATPTGGLAPFTYVWRVNGTQVQSGSSSSFARRLYDYSEINVVVTDARGHTRNATVDVSVYSDNSCPPPEIICE